MTADFLERESALSLVGWTRLIELGLDADAEALADGWTEADAVAWVVVRKRYAWGVGKLFGHTEWWPCA